MLRPVRRAPVLTQEILSDCRSCTSTLKSSRHHKDQAANFTAPAAGAHQTPRRPPPSRRRMALQLPQQMPHQLLRQLHNPMHLAVALWRAHPDMISASLKRPLTILQLQTAAAALPALSSRKLVHLTSQQLTGWAPSCTPILSCHQVAQLLPWQLLQELQTRIPLPQVAEQLPQQLHQTLQAWPCSAREAAARTVESWQACSDLNIHLGASKGHAASQ